MSKIYMLKEDYSAFPKGTFYEKVDEETIFSKTSHLLKCLSDGNYKIRVTEQELKEEFELIEE
jgi:hypothetical protein